MLLNKTFGATCALLTAPGADRITERDFEDHFAALRARREQQLLFGKRQEIKKQGTLQRDIER